MKTHIKLTATEMKCCFEEAAQLLFFENPIGQDITEAEQDEINAWIDGMGKEVGDEILIQADDVLGSPECTGTITKVDEDCYWGYAHDDDEQGIFPIGFDGRVLCDM
jgi:hypothetical protein